MAKIKINEQDIRNMVFDVINNILGNDKSLRLNIGYNYEIKENPRSIKDKVIFSIMYGDEKVGECVFCGGTIPNKMMCKLNLDNLDDSDREAVVSQLNGSQIGQYAYDDSPDEIYNCSIADVKEFISRNIDNAIGEFMESRHYPDWQKKRALNLINTAKEEGWE